MHGDDTNPYGPPPGPEWPDWAPSAPGEPTAAAWEPPHLFDAYGTQDDGPGSHDPMAPHATAGAYDQPGAPDLTGAAPGPTDTFQGPPPDGANPPVESRPGGGRAGRRFGAMALGLALIAGGGAGAATSALLSGGSRTVVSASGGVPATPLAASATTSTTQALVNRVEPALVDIHTTGTSATTSPEFGNGENPFGGNTSTTEAAGTGMVLTSNGLVLTNAHVLEGETSITVNVDGKTANHTATLVGEDAARDVALIQIQGVSGLPTVSLGDSSKAQVGDAVLAIGNALDLQAGGFTASDGIISGLGRSIQTDNNESLSGLIQTSAAISSGDSGGPLVDAAGQVIGMDTAAAASSSTNTASNIGFAIPSAEIAGLIPQLEKGNIGTPTTGSAGSSGSGSSGGSGSYGYGSGGGYGSGSGSESGGGYGSYGGYGSGGGLGSLFG